MNCDLPLILLYHKIKPIGNKSTLCVLPADFSNQMQYLLENNFCLKPLHSLADKTGENRKAAIVTFDDGYKDNYLNAYPVLREFKIPATIFITAGLTGRRSLWDERSGLPGDELLSWPEIKEMSENNITIGSHSANHYNLTKKRWIADLWYEISRSKKIIEQKINKEVLFFSYPFGRSNILVRQMVKMAGYSAACGIGPPGSKGKVDIYNLPRLEINTAASSADKFASLIKKYIN